MKRFLIIATLILTTISAVFANETDAKQRETQNYFLGLKGGLGISAMTKPSSMTETEFNTRFGNFLSAFIDLDFRAFFSAHIGLKVDVTYTIFMAERTQESYRERFTYITVDLCPVLRYKILNFYAGIWIGFNDFAGSVPESMWIGPTVKYTDAVDMVIGLKAGVDINIKLSDNIYLPIGVEFKYLLHDVVKSESFRYYGIYGTIGIMFAL
jgi:opacity protein-like surface antigen